MLPFALLVIFCNQWRQVQELILWIANVSICLHVQSQQQVKFDTLDLNSLAFAFRDLLAYYKNSPYTKCQMTIDKKTTFKFDFTQKGSNLYCLR